SLDRNACSMGEFANAHGFFHPIYRTLLTLELLQGLEWQVSKFRVRTTTACAMTTEELSRLTASSRLLDYAHPDIARLVTDRGWADLPLYERIGAIYNFVRDDILFGYNASDDLPASRVLADRIGQCNTKSTLLMALLRAVDVPCRFHGFTIDKALQKGAITGLWYQ